MIHKFLLKTTPFYFLVTISLIGILLSFSMAFIESYFVNDITVESSMNLQDLTVGAIVDAVLISPFIETFIFQYMLIFGISSILEKRFSFKSYPLAILISALLFGAIHCDSFSYVISAFIMGIYFGYIAVVSEVLRKQKISVLVSVFFVHALVNLISILIVFYYQ